jgi:hypothetical protein
MRAKRVTAAFDLKRKCPTCGKVLTYADKKLWHQARRRNSGCDSHLSLLISRAKKGCKNPHKANVKWTKKLRAKASASRIGKCVGAKRTFETCMKISLALSGKRKSEAHRLKCIKHAKHFGVSVDAGASEYFNAMNLHNGFHIQHPNVRFKELGYFADGYDAILHAWFEYDTPSHSSRRAQERDARRQSVIIQHFVRIGKPLSHFFRINRTGRGDSGMRDILKEIS